MWVPLDLAGDVGFAATGTIILDRDTHAALFTDGLLDTMPNEPLTLQTGIIPQIVLPGTQGPIHVNDVAPLLNPEPGPLLLGSNGWNLPGTCAWVDLPEPTSGLLNIAYPDTRIGDVKHTPDDSIVVLHDKIVTAGEESFLNVFYVEDMLTSPDGDVTFPRSSGLRVDSKLPGMDIRRDYIVTVSGRLTTVDGERTIAEAVVTGGSSVYSAAPVGMNNRSVAGASWPFTSGVLGGVVFAGVGGTADVPAYSTEADLLRISGLV